MRWDHQALEASRQGTAVWVLEAERYSLLNMATDELQAADPETAEARLHEFERLRDHSHTPASAT